MASISKESMLMMPRIFSCGATFIYLLIHSMQYYNTVQEPSQLKDLNHMMIL